MNGISVSRDGAVLRVVLDRPDKLNAVDTPMLTELSARLAEAAADASVRVVALTGAGRAFCSGGDLTGRNTEGAAEAANQVVRALTTLPKPVIAGVHGPAAGFGCPLALACDLVVAARSAYFQLAFARVGLMPDGGASALLPRAIGRARAARMAMTAEKVSATQAFEWGLVSHVVDDDAYERELASLSASLAEGPTQSYRWTKKALAAATLAELDAVQEIEIEGQRALVATNDFREARAAFRERRRPKFGGT
ncbi:enoyl-CoA hydratase/isomerase family protein [Mycolicibacterium flavescens]|uniref:Crotonase n=1 Tax=Mycolicibacterium flavescens TaxID=1776 RepID=A0A1E3RHM4_MYCFV|nr:enoyl-CoA hydratase-related protein [Mycolicibacterium flavescens]MCV7280276.1 enoyl-CoA hydratase/isomerase family protein [Mycolicibacterium flavescens]ODQ89360.1 crotonase [Mycolicibacterium flavescens]